MIVSPRNLSKSGSLAVARTIRGFAGAHFLKSS